MTTIFKEEYRFPIFSLIKNCYAQTCNDLLALNNESTKQLSSDLKRLFYLYNKKQFNQLKGIYESIYKITWNKLIEEGAWNHVCLRESFIMGQLAGITYYYSQNHYNKTLEICDQSFIMGAPKELLLPIMNELSIKLKEQQDTTYDDYKVLPMILDENINFDKFPNINRDCKFQIKVVSCNSSFGSEEYKKEFEIFKNQHLETMTPCIIRGDTKNWSCINKWMDLNYFLSNYGNRIVPIELGHNKLDSLNITAATKKQEQQLDWSEKLMKLNEFIENYMIPSSLDNNSIDTQPSKVAYLAQHSLIEQLPSLIQDFQFPLFLQSTGNAKIHETDEEGISPHIWFGTGNTVTPLHFDSYDNFLTQIVGYKYVRLYPNNQSDNLYINQDGDDSISKKTSQNNISLVDIENPNLEKYPLLKNANQQYTEAILKPGDILFMPSGYFHYIRSLSTSLSLSFWFIKK